MNARLTKASAAFSRLHKNVWDRRGIILETILKVYKAIVLTTLLHGCESWTVNQRHVRKLNHFHTSSLRKFLSIRWQDKIPDTDTAQPCQLTQHSHNPNTVTAVPGRPRSSHVGSSASKEAAIWRAPKWKKFPRRPKEWSLCESHSSCCSSCSTSSEQSLNLQLVSRLLVAVIVSFCVSFSAITSTGISKPPWTSGDLQWKVTSGIFGNRPGRHFHAAIAIAYRSNGLYFFHDSISISKNFPMFCSQRDCSCLLQFS